MTHDLVLTNSSRAYQGEVTKLGNEGQIWRTWWGLFSATIFLPKVFDDSIQVTINDTLQSTRKRR